MATKKPYEKPEVKQVNLDELLAAQYLKGYKEGSEALHKDILQLMPQIVRDFLDNKPVSVDRLLIELKPWLEKM
jgi:hypothetical protein